MNKTDHYFLGYISKTIGHDNRLLIQMDTDDPGYYKKLDALFVDLNGTLTPFFVTAARVQPPTGLVVQLEDVDESMASELVGNEVFLPLKNLPPLKGKKFYFHEVIGYKVFDKEKGELGVLASVYDRATQAVFQVMQDKTEIMIPVVDELIDHIDREKKELHLNCPEGLIDIYLGNSDEEEGLI